MITEKTEDRRVRKTKKLLRDGLAKLMKEKPIKSITVRELSELVDINRGTFYLHYKDIYDMVESIQSEMFEEFNKTFDEYDADGSEETFIAILTEIFEHIAADSDIVTALIGKNGSALFVDRLKNIVKEKCLSSMYYGMNADKTTELKYFYYFAVSGFIGIFQEWLNGGMKETPKEMAEMTANMMFKGLNSIK